MISCYTPVTVADTYQEPDLSACSSHHLNRIVGPPGLAEILPGISAQTQPKLLDIFHLSASSPGGGGERDLHNNLMGRGPVMASVRNTFVSSGSKSGQQ